MLTLMLIDALAEAGKMISEDRSDRLQTALDQEFLAGKITEAQYDIACRQLESVTEYE